MTEKHTDPKELFQQAEALRKANKPDEAQEYYQQAVRSSNERTLARGKAAIQRTEQARSALRGKSSWFFLVPLLVAGIAFAVFRYIDRLIDDGFFEDFDQVIFYGAGPCGYAAAAFSVAAPGAKVVVVQPQATLDPRVTEWDDRFTHMRRTSFTNRYGYAPDMLDAADQAFVLYDPAEDLDAMHAALFTRPNVTKLRMRFMGGALQTDLMEMQILLRLLAKVGTGKLDEDSFAKLYRARRDYNRYLRGLMARLDSRERYYMTALLCRNVVRRLVTAPRFRHRFAALEREAEAGNIKLPPPYPETPETD